MKAAGISQNQLGAKLGVSQQLIGQLLSGKTRTTKHIFRIAAALHVRASYLDDDIPVDSTGNVVPIVGYVGAGDAAHYYADAQGAGEYVTMPSNGTEQTVAVEVRGASLGPALNGSIIYYNDVRSPPTPDLLRRLCVVGLNDDRVLVKLLYPGSEPGLYNLHSNNNDPIIENVTIAWAAKVTYIMPPE